MTARHLLPFKPGVHSPLLDIPRKKRRVNAGTNDLDTRGQPNRLTAFDRAVITEYMRDFSFSETGKRLGMEGDRARINTSIKRYMRSRPWVRDEVNRRLELRRDLAEISEQRILEELRRIAYSNPLYHARVYDDDGNARLELGLLTEADMAGISSIEQKKDGSIKIKLHDKLDAIDKIGRRLKLFGADNERSAPTTVRFIIEDSPRSISGDGGARRIAGEVRIGHDSGQSQGTGVAEHVSVEGPADSRSGR